MASKSNKSLAPTEPNIKDAVEAKDSTPAPEEQIKVAAPEKREVESLQHFFGKRKLEPFDNSEILRCRLLYQVESSKIKNCLDIINKDTGKTLGVVPKLQLVHSWRMAHSKDAQKVVKNKLFFMTREEWEEDSKRLEKYINSKRDAYDKNKPIFFSDVWKLSEIEYESVGLKRPQQFMALLQTAILGDMEENRRIMAAWRKIKKYSHKVPLEISRGGIFTADDAHKLTQMLNIKYLNDIRKLDVFALKNAVLDYDFEQIVKDINAAYKEDLARRRDFRYKVHPFVAAFANLAIILYFAFKNKYTLIKNEPLTDLIMLLLSLCVLDAFVILVGGWRGKRRRRKRYDYVYYSAPVKKSIGFFACIGIFAVASVFVFYQRYDNYDNTLYYRDLDDGTVAVAGLRDEDIDVVNIPDYVDGKAVSEIDLYAFNKDTVNEVVLPAAIKKIDTAAFNKCTNLTLVTIPDGVVEIGKSAFKNCYSLSSVNIPAGVEEIKKDTFRNSGIEALSFSENGEISIAKNAFRGCSNLSIIANMSAVTSVGDNAFRTCTSLNSFSFSDKLESIGKQAFMNCSSIVTVEFPATMQTIGQKAFMYCSSIVTVELPSSIESIGKKAFYYCNSIENLTVPFTGLTAQKSAKQNLNKIVKFDYPEGRRVNVTLNSSNPVGKKAFKNSPWVISISLDDSITEIHEKAFNGATRLESIKMSASITTIRESMFKDNDHLKAMTGMGKVIAIEKDAFRNCTSLISLDLEAVEIINESAFEHCEQLTTLGSLNSLKKIGAGAFTYCRALSELGELSSLESIGSYAFDNCYSLNGTFHMGASMREISAYAFSNSNFTAISGDDGLVNVGDYAFAGCINIQNVDLPATVETIGNSAFSNCIDLNSIEFSESLKSIGEGAFMGCYLLDSVKLPASLTAIGNSAFASCSNLKIAQLSDTSVSSMGVNVFQNCTGLESVTLPTDMTVIPDNTFAGCTSFDGLYGITNSAQLSIETIGTGAFEGCSMDQMYLAIPTSVKTIGSRAFAKTGISNLTIPANVETIGQDAFVGCGNLNAAVVAFLGRTPDNTESGYSWVFGSSPVSYITLTDTKNVKSNTFEGGKYYLTSVTLAEGTERIEANAFANLDNLATVNIPSTVNFIGESAFESCENLVNISIPSGVKTISKAAFKNCSSLEISIPSLNVTSIGEEAFMGTSVSSGTLIFHNSVKSVGANAFANVDIEEVIITENLTGLDVDAFGKKPKITILVPNKELLEKYTKLFEDYKNVDITLN